MHRSEPEAAGKRTAAGGPPPSSTPSTSSTAAFFDVDGTLVDSTIVHYYLYFRRRLMGRWAGRVWQATYYLRCGYFLILDRIDRLRMNVAFYGDYAGLNSDAVRGLADDCHRDVIGPKLYADAVACVGAHQRAGHRVVFVTGSLDFIMAPLARELGIDDVIAARMIERDGRFTGTLDGPPIGERVKAERVRAFAEAHGIDLSRSHAYGDSVADVPMLECVGHPHAVNPDGALRSMARSRGWSTHQWSRVGLSGTPVTV